MGRGFGRDGHRTVGKMVIPQMSVASGGSVTDTEEVTINGAIKSLTATISNDTNGITFTISITDADGSVLFITEALAVNGIRLQQFMTLSLTDLPLNILCAGKITVSAIPSGDPGDGGVTVDVSLYVE